jgi:hypothetical protein
MRRSKDHLGKWQQAIGQVAASDWASGSKRLGKRQQAIGQAAASDWASGSKREADQHRLSTDENGHAPTDIKT